MAFFNGKLYLAWVEDTNQKYIWLMSSDDGKNWGNKVSIIQSTDVSANLRVVDGKLFLLWRGFKSTKNFFIVEITDNIGIFFGKTTQLYAASNGAPNLIKNGSEYVLMWTNDSSILTAGSSTIDFRTTSSNQVKIKESSESSGTTPSLANFLGANLIAWTSGELSHHLYLSALSNFI